MNLACIQILAVWDSRIWNRKRSGSLQFNGQVDREGVRRSVKASPGGERTRRAGEHASAAFHGTFHRESEIRRTRVPSGTRIDNVDLIAVEIGEDPRARVYLIASCLFTEYDTPPSNVD